MFRSAGWWRERVAPQEERVLGKRIGIRRRGPQQHDVLAQSQVAIHALQNIPIYVLTLLDLMKGNF